jgi:hypothetical protein
VRLPPERRDYDMLERAITGADVPAPWRKFTFPKGTELLHTVRYLDPTAPSGVGARLKELRYARKIEELDAWANVRAYEKEAEERDEGVMPRLVGNHEHGAVTPFGWQLQGWIEDARGELRLQTDDEHRFCVGCHSSVGVTIDHTFSFARKVPGKDGWRVQDLRGMRDVPARGQSEPEALVYMRRAQGADDYGANDEMKRRFFDGPRPLEREVRRAALGGDKDLHWLVYPSAERALLLDKAYMLLVRSQRFVRGRDASLSPPPLVLARIDEEETGLGRAGLVFLDQTLALWW